MSHSVKQARRRFTGSSEGTNREYDLRSRIQRGANVNPDDDVAGRDIRMAFIGMGLLILAALIVTLLS